MKFYVTKSLLAIILATVHTGVMAHTQTTADQWEQNRITYEKKQSDLAEKKVSLFSHAEILSPTIEEHHQKGNAKVTLQSIRLDGDGEAFPFLMESIKKYEHKTVDVKAINALVNELNNALIERGYVTSQVTIPEQNLRDGLLRLYVMAGRVDTVVLPEPYRSYHWQNAFPIREGDILNVRALEQGLEQVKMMSSADIHMKLLPSTKAGYSIVVLFLQEGKRGHGVLTIDNGGVPETGKWQISTTVGVDHFFQDTDTLTLSFHRDAFTKDSPKGAKGYSVDYSFPRGWHTFTVSYNEQRFHQWIGAKPEPFLSSGRSHTLSGTWKRTIHRDRESVWSVYATLSKKISHHAINDTELELQAKDITALETGLSYRRYIKQDTWIANLAYKRGLGWFGAMKDYGSEDIPTSRYAMVIYDIDYKHPFRWHHDRIETVYTASLHGQHTFGQAPLFDTDMVAIGGRYTVRGFDGFYSLQGNSGWYVRQELTFPFKKIPAQVYLGLDVGHVYGPGTEFNIGHTLVGSAIGLRGQVGPYSRFDVSVGVPLRYPKGFRTDPVTTTFSISLIF